MSSCNAQLQQLQKCLSEKKSVCNAVAAQQAACVTARDCEGSCSTAKLDASIKHYFRQCGDNSLSKAILHAALWKSWTRADLMTETYLLIISEYQMQTEMLLFWYNLHPLTVSKHVPRLALLDARRIFCLFLSCEFPPFLRAECRRLLRSGKDARPSLLTNQPTPVVSGVSACRIHRALLTSAVPSTAGCPLCWTRSVRAAPHTSTDNDAPRVDLASKQVHDLLVSNAILHIRGLNPNESTVELDIKKQLRAFSNKLSAGSESDIVSIHQLGQLAAQDVSTVVQRLVEVSMSNEAQAAVMASLIRKLPAILTWSTGNSRHDIDSQTDSDCESRLDHRLWQENLLCSQVIKCISEAPSDSKSFGVGLDRFLRGLCEPSSCICEESSSSAKLPLLLASGCKYLLNQLIESCQPVKLRLTLVTLRFVFSRLQSLQCPCYSWFLDSCPVIVCVRLAMVICRGQRMPISVQEEVRSLFIDWLTVLETLSLRDVELLRGELLEAKQFMLSLDWRYRLLFRFLYQRAKVPLDWAIPFASMTVDTVAATLEEVNCESTMSQVVNRMIHVLLVGSLTDSWADHVLRVLISIRTNAKRSLLGYCLNRPHLTDRLLTGAIANTLSQLTTSEARRLVERFMPELLGDSRSRAVVSYIQSLDLKLQWSIESSVFEHVASVLKIALHLTADWMRSPSFAVAAQPDAMRLALGRLVDRLLFVSNKWGCGSDIVNECLDGFQNLLVHCEASPCQ